MVIIVVTFHHIFTTEICINRKRRIFSSSGAGRDIVANWPATTSSIDLKIPCHVIMPLVNKSFDLTES